VVAPLGTGTTILVALQLVTVAVVPLNFTVLLPCVDPKVVPVIVTEAPTAPEVGDRLVILGTTVKLDPLLFTPLANTTTFPVVAHSEPLWRCSSHSSSSPLPSFH
jgi:hypothetical protein